jgi:hypothetical protein
VEVAPNLSIESDSEKPLLDRILEKFSPDDDDELRRLKMESNPAVHMYGRRFRALTGGDVCVETVDVSGHFHAGHPPTVKVRPALGVPLFSEPPHEGHHGQSKLGPSIQDSPKFPFASKAKPPAPILVSVPLDAQDTEDGRGPKPQDAVPTPVLATHEDEQDRESDSAGEVDIPVRHPRSSTARRNTDVSQIKHELKSYWGFSTPDKVPSDQNVSLSAGIIKPAKSTDDYGRGEAWVSEQDPALEQEEHVHSFSGEHEAEGLLGRGDQADAHQSWIYSRTSRWLKDLLNHPEPYSSKLTQAPRRTTLHDLPFRSHENTVLAGSTHSDRRKSSLGSRALTRRSTVKAAQSVDNRYKSTVKDLENILTSAVELAKEAVDQFEYHPLNKSDDQSMPGSYPDNAEMQFTHVRCVYLPSFDPTLGTL